MAKPKGSPKIGGRQKGTPNKTTSETRQAVNMLVSNNMPNAQAWLDKIASTNPAKALELLIKLTELVMPKLIAEAEIDSTKKDNFYEKQANLYISKAKAG